MVYILGRNMEYTKLIVDGYNVINFAFKVERESLEKKRSRLIEKMVNFSAYTGIKVVIVFDGQGGLRSKERFEGVKVIFSKKGQSADSVIERLLYQEENHNSVAVASSDNALRDMAFGSGANCIYSLDLIEEVIQAEEEMRIGRVN